MSGTHEDEQAPAGSQQNARSGGVFIIRDLETLRTIADPLRTEIVEHLIDASLTVKELAARLGLAPSRLYYHMSVLEEHGLIRVVDQHIVGNLVEKVYTAAAREIEVAPELVSFGTSSGKKGIAALVTSTLDATRDDLLRSLEARTAALAAGAPERPRQLMVNRLVERIPESRAAEFHKRLVALIREFDDAGVDPDSVDEEVHSYAMTVALYPHYHFPGEASTAEKAEEV